MPWPLPVRYEIAEETRFGDRRLNCFASRPGNVDQLLRGSAANDPKAEAIVDGDRRMSYAALDEAVNKVAANLRNLGLEQGDRLALLLANRAEFVIVAQAAARLGVITVPVNIREQTPELEYILNHCGAKVLVHEADLEPRLPNADALTSLQHRFSIGGETSLARPFAELMTSVDVPVPEIEFNEEDTAVILYTSGTTGRPKGAMLTHVNIVHSVMHFDTCFELGEKERSLLAVPASHVTGLVAIIHTMLGLGGCIVMMRAFDAKEFLALAAAEKVTALIMVPAMYNLCLLRADFANYDLSAWRIGGFGGAPMPEDTIHRLAEAVPGLVLTNTYGATETTSPTALMPPGHGPEHPDSVGQVVPCGYVLVMDDNGVPVAPGKPGEIWIGGPMVVPGYWQNEEATAREFSGGYWKSGDIGSLDTRGYLRIFDRKKDMINRGGYNIYSAEIENALSLHEGVVESAVIGVADPVLGEKTHVHVCVRDDALREEDVKAWCGERLADYKIPDFVTLSGEPLPRNANGKIVKRALRES
ncbi:MAG: acyl--CoA ligase [Alphaproteobacteria bacterium]|jgi:long-chain acyl-CoA synthetase|nr:acyl--CoA ligase [Alphaproteobacteria bacterium]MBT4083722.1 acyl--CoA ligase [Alphaproteobacteria bacterium]MBT4545244.1 acyl--CoA ligase [Alphaproteobacteria bacterium]MBT5917203.1 acyl--CoA ligase [Alphaproteobacteria bacterium]MBT6386206.1 acyl--CoA ligase [Alphaproteobacteria bacterium]